MTRFFRTCLVASLLLLTSIAPVPSAQAEVVERIVAVVGNEVITLSELNELVDTMHGPTLAAIPEKDARQAQRKELQRALLDQMIDQRLMTQQYNKLQITAAETDIDRVIESILKQNNITLEVLTNEVQRQGLTMAQYRDQMRQHVLSSRFVEQQIRPKISITEEDIKNLYTQRIGEVDGEEVLEIAGVLVTRAQGGSPEAVEQSKKQAVRVQEQLKAGTSPDDIAKQSNDGTVVSLGNMGSFRKGELMPEIDAAIFTLNQGDVSSPVESAQGLYILKIVSKGKQTSVKPYAEVRDQLYRRLYDQQTELQMGAFLRNARKETHVESLL